MRRDGGGMYRGWGVVVVRKGSGVRIVFGIGCLMFGRRALMGGDVGIDVMIVAYWPDVLGTTFLAVEYYISERAQMENILDERK